MPLDSLAPKLRRVFHGVENDDAIGDYATSNSRAAWLRVAAKCQQQIDAATFGMLTTLYGYTGAGKSEAVRNVCHKMDSTGLLFRRVREAARVIGAEAGNAK